MAQVRRESWDLIIAGAVQFCVLVFAAWQLDMGQFAVVTARISAGFWAGVIIVLVRRHRSLTRGDHFFIRYGLLLFWVAGVPLTLTAWALRGAI